MCAIKVDILEVFMWCMSCGVKRSEQIALQSSSKTPMYIANFSNFLKRNQNMRFFSIIKKETLPAASTTKPSDAVMQ
jgi:hypothetical protein